MCILHYFGSLNWALCFFPIKMSTEFMHAQLEVECVACLHKCCIKSHLFLKLQLKYLADIPIESSSFPCRRIMQRECLFVHNYVILNIVDSCARIEIPKTKLSFVNLTKLKFCTAYSFCP